MAKSIAEQIEDLQKENERLRELEKLFEKAVKTHYGVGSKFIKKMIEKEAQNSSDFEKKICMYFNLIFDEDKADFISIICEDSILHYYNAKKYEMPTDQQG